MAGNTYILGRKESHGTLESGHIVHSTEAGIDALKEGKGLAQGHIEEECGQGEEMFPVSEWPCRGAMGGQFCGDSGRLASWMGWGLTPGKGHRDVRSRLSDLGLGLLRLPWKGPH